MTALDIFTYSGQQVRTIVVDGEPWFVAADVARILDLGNPRSSLALLDDDEKGVHSVDTLGGAQATSIINESGMYSLILRSRKPEAKEFKRWLTHEVLPQIRKTGAYVAPVDQLEQIRALHAAVGSLLEQNALDAPKAAAWDALASAEGDYSVGDAAKFLARAGVITGPTRLFQQLADIKWTFRAGDGAWRAYAERVEKGYLSEKPQFHYHPGTGERVVDPPQVRVTVKGLERLRQRLHNGGLQAAS